ncbi:NAD(P)H-dependent oxidoreductase [Paenibacillaceae bacterium WGS1546]|uniref:NAD(P)H-dependent oxidoreductase n=1 Tax=Cohnella sp. WGS1546 TaxID=3366810 RepID=UPI00372D02C9
MNHLIIYAHANGNSFNAAVRDTIANALRERDQEVAIRDLYALNFNPVLTDGELNGFYERKYAADLEEEHRHIRWADALYFVFPTWWYGRPAILKGYIDRVFSTGFAFRYSKQGPIGLLTDKKAFVFQTAADPEQTLTDRDLLTAMRNSIDVGILNYCGLEVLGHKFMTGIHHVSDETRQQYLQEVEDTILASPLDVGAPVKK